MITKGFVPLTVHSLECLLVAPRQGLFTKLVVVLHLILILLQSPGVQPVGKAQGDKADDNGHERQATHAENVACFGMRYHAKRQHKNRVNPDQKCFHGCRGSL